LKLMALIAKKFRKIKGVNQFARSALPALLKLLQLPTARPLARLCHKLHLVEHLSELNASLDVSQNAAAASPSSLGGFRPPAHRHREEEDEEDENQEDENEEEEHASGDEEHDVSATIVLNPCRSARLTTVAGR
jgi:hypothetical protein